MTMKDVVVEAGKLAPRGRSLFADSAIATLADAITGRNYSTAIVKEGREQDMVRLWCRLFRREPISDREWKESETWIIRPDQN